MEKEHLTPTERADLEAFVESKRSMILYCAKVH